MQTELHVFCQKRCCTFCRSFTDPCVALLSYFSVILNKTGHKQQRADSKTIPGCSTVASLSMMRSYDGFKIRDFNLHTGSDCVVCWLKLEVWRHSCLLSPTFGVGAARRACLSQRLAHADSCRTPHPFVLSDTTDGLRLWSTREMERTESGARGSQCVQTWSLMSKLGWCLRTDTPIRIPRSTNKIILTQDLKVHLRRMKRQKKENLQPHKDRQNKSCRGTMLSRTAFLRHSRSGAAGIPIGQAAHSNCKHSNKFGTRGKACCRSTSNYVHDEKRD